MARFSERIGVTQVRSVIQVESIDVPLRNKLWSVLYVYLDPDNDSSLALSPHEALYRDIWLNFFERPIDRMPVYSSRFVEEMRSYFYAEDWYKPYDLLEFCLTRPGGLGSGAIELANLVLQDYLSGYRFVSGKLVPVTDDSHIQAIEDALATATNPARTHLNKSLALLGDRQYPDSENAMKEAISAVEATCSAIVGQRGASLGDALKKLEDAGVVIHPALKGAWLKVYGYTSDADGIRHALHGESSATVDDALYFLVTCSAFVSLLTTKAAAVGLTLSTP